MKRPADIHPHPAEYSDEVLAEFEKMVPRGVTLLDPMAGTGWKLANALPGRKIIGIELEPEWAAGHPSVMQGDARALPFKNGRFRWVVTSPVYGNRMSDHHNAMEKCKNCGGSGEVYDEHGQFQMGDCPKCDGEGKRTYKRLTYRHQLGRMPSAGSTAVLQWGPEYQAMHRAIWEEVYRVTRKGDGHFLLNIKDHVRDKEMQPVTQWHVETLVEVGFTEVDRIPVFTQGMGFGANREARAEHEWIIHFEKAA